MKIHVFSRGNFEIGTVFWKKIIFVFSSIEAALWTKAVICNLMGFLCGQAPKPGDKLVLNHSCSLAAAAQP